MTPSADMRRIDKKFILLFTFLIVLCYIGISTRKHYLDDKLNESSTGNERNIEQLEKYLFSEVGLRNINNKHQPDKGKYTLENSPWIYRGDNITQPYSTEKKKLYWYEHTSSNGRTVSAPHIDRCPYPCEYTDDPTIADLVVIEGNAMINTPLTKDNMWKRPSYQLWMYWTDDPVNYNMGLDSPVFKHMFNLTSTHLMTSDVPSFLGMINPNPIVKNKDYRAVFRQKSKFAAWIVSHCDTKGLREVYVYRMQSVAHVDIFGRCGSLDIPKDDSAVISELTNNYKFYLSFENTFCKDYVSEKFFKTFDNTDIIPVVRGGVDYNSVFPKDTFVNAADFDSPENLTKYLVQLGNDEDAYIKMLEAKEKWTLTHEPKTHTMCRMCKFLAEGGQGHYIEDIDKHIREEHRACWKPTDLGLDTSLLFYLST